MIIYIQPGLRWLTHTSMWRYNKSTAGCSIKKTYVYRQKIAGPMIAFKDERLYR